MNSIKTVGELMAHLAGLPAETPVTMPAQGLVFPEPGLYVMRWAAGTCSRERVEIHQQLPSFAAVTFSCGPAVTASWRTA